MQLLLRHPKPNTTRTALHLTNQRNAKLQWLARLPACYASLIEIDKVTPDLWKDLITLVKNNIKHITYMHEIVQSQDTEQICLSDYRLNRNTMCRVESDTRQQTTVKCKRWKMRALLLYIYIHEHMLRENTNWQDLENSLLWWPKKKKKMAINAP